MTKARIGIWLIGARGGVATTTIVGLIALEKQWIGGTGLVSQLPQFQHLDLPAWDSFVVGGHEIRDVSLAGEAARLMAEMRAAARSLPSGAATSWTEIDGRIRPGTLRSVGPTIAKLADPELLGRPRRIAAPDRRPAAGRPERVRPRKQAGARRGRERGLDGAGGRRGSCLPPTWAELEPLLAEPSCPLPASSLYAIAALGLGFSYVNFTPSLGAAPAAIDELARLRGGRHAGCDGKTGETLLKSVLAPLMAQRNLQRPQLGRPQYLRQPRWPGAGRPGQQADQDQEQGPPAGRNPRLPPANARFHRVHREPGRMEDGLGPHPFRRLPRHAHDLAVHLAGLRFGVGGARWCWTWCGLTEVARRRGETGLLGFLASFFKSPLGVAEHRFDRQFQMFERLGRRHPLPSPSGRGAGGEGRPPRCDVALLRRPLDTLVITVILV